MGDTAFANARRKFGVASARINGLFQPDVSAQTLLGTPPTPPDLTDEAVQAAARAQRTRVGMNRKSTFLTPAGYRPPSTLLGGK